MTRRNFTLALTALVVAVVTLAQKERELSVSQRSAVALPTPSCPWLSPSSFSFHDATHRALTLFRTELLPG